MHSMCVDTGYGILFHVISWNLHFSSSARRVETFFFFRGEYNDVFNDDDGNNDILSLS